MAATVLEIESRWKVHVAAAGSPNDFEVHKVGSLDPSRLLDDPTLSLYTVDPLERAALFVRTPAEIDLSRAPFLWHTQFVEATEVISLPFHELAELTAQASIPFKRLVFIHSTGRCGSTLVSLALAEADDLVALSEPEVFIQLQQMRDRGDSEVDNLLQDLYSAPVCSEGRQDGRDQASQPEHRVGRALAGVAFPVRRPFFFTARLKVGHARRYGRRWPVQRRDVGDLGPVLATSSPASPLND